MFQSEESEIVFDIEATALQSYYKVSNICEYL